MKRSILALEPRHDLPRSANERIQGRLQRPPRRSCVWSWLRHSCLHRQDGKHFVQGDRKVSNPRAACIVDSIGERRGGPADSQFADALALQWIGPVVEQGHRRTRSEEHTSELQSPDHLVCRLLLEKKKY